VLQHPHIPWNQLNILFRPGTFFESFHHQAKILISNRALLAGFLMLW